MLRTALLIATLLAGSSGAQELSPTVADVAYGPDPAQRMDLWLAPDGPAPLVVHIHRGGWFCGSRKARWEGPEPFLARGISVARVDYRLTPQHPLPAPVLDVALAVQFLRAHAAEWNLDPERFAAIGWSAGGTTALWLAFHDDLADPDSPDPVRRQSTRLSVAVALGAPTSIDPRVIRRWMGADVPWHLMIPAAVGESDMDAVFSHLQEHERTYREYSPIRHLDGGDPPILLRYFRDETLPPADEHDAIHHPVFGSRLKARADSVGTECVLVTGTDLPPEERKSSLEFLEFLVQHLGLGPAKATR